MNPEAMVVDFSMMMNQLTFIYGRFCETSTTFPRNISSSVDEMVCPGHFIQDIVRYTTSPNFPVSRPLRAKKIQTVCVNCFCDINAVNA